MITLSILLIIAVVGGVLLAVDGLNRVRTRATIIGLIELAVAFLLLLSLFEPRVPFDSMVLAIIGVVVLVVGIITRRKGATIPIIALVFLAAWIVLEQRWVEWPGVN